MSLISNLSEIQNQASNPNFCVWVSASAGSGKTSLLKNRYLRLILSGVPIEKILCITYTNAGTNEMKERILADIKKWQNLNDSELKENLNSLLFKQPTATEINNARKAFNTIINNKDGFNIRTIHSFCQTILKKFPFEAGVSVNFTAIDANKQRELILNSWQRVQNNYLTDDKFLQAVKILKNQLDTGSIDGFIIDVAKNKDKIFLSTNNHIKERLGLKNIEKFEDIVAKPSPKIFEFIKQYSKKLDSYNKNMQIINQLIDWFDEKNFYNYAYIFLTKEDLLKRKTIADFCNKNPDFNQFIEEEVERISKIIAQINGFKIYEFSNASLYLSQLILREYESIKKYYGFVDFDDQIERVKNLLCNSEFSAWINYKLDTKIEHILLDEAQDTSPKQWEIMSAIGEEFFSGEGASNNNRTIFVVGDEKQSIFSFQGANINIFKQMYQFYASKAGQINKPFFQINLDFSFRSAKPILALVDSIFSNPEMAKKISIMGEDIRHRVFRENAFGKVVLMKLFQAEASSKPPENLDELLQYLVSEDEFETYHKLFAKKVAKFIQEKIKNEGLEYKDFMLLYRKSARIVPFIQAAFQAEKIHLSGASDLDLQEHIIAKHLIGIAKALLNLQDDFSLTHLLKSPIFNLSFAELTPLLQNRNEPLIDIIAVQKNEIYNTIITLQLLAKNSSPYEFYFDLLSKYNKNFYLVYGTDAEKIIHQFLEVARTVNVNQAHNLELFINWFNLSNFKITNSSNNNENAVQLLSIHASKGLQAKVVVLLDSYANASYNRDKLLFENDLCLFIPPKSDAETVPYINNIIQQQNQYQEAEDKRLLYVALTRAEDELYIMAMGSTSLKENSSSWYNIIEQGILSAHKINPDLILENNFSDELFEKLSLSNNKVLTKKDKGDKEKHSNYIELKEMSELKFNGSDSGSHQPNIIPEYKVERGNIIHTVLSKIKTPAITMAYIDNLLNNLNYQEVGLSQKLFSIVQTHHEVFSQDSHAEQELMFNSNLYRIDRLVINHSKKQIKIIDFKTDADTTLKNIYKNQLDNYKNSIELIYPNYEISTYILWIENGKLVAV